MTERPVGIRVLMMSNDVRVIEILSRFLQHFAAQVEIVSDSLLAMRKLCRAKFEGIVLDLTDKEPGLQLLDRLHSISAHRGVVIFAIVTSDQDNQEAFRAGANFVLQRPLSSGIVARTLRAAYPLMVRERRRYFRCPLDAAIAVSNGSDPEFTARAVNISEGGMALTSPKLIRVGDKLRLAVSLEPTLRPMHLVAEVCWVDANNRAGLKFLQIVSESQQQLRHWLAIRLEAEVPPVPPQEIEMAARN